jgi:hypothetical protein
VRRLLFTAAAGDPGLTDPDDAVSISGLGFEWSGLDEADADSDLRNSVSSGVGPPESNADHVPA